jgi:cation transport ATPase
MHKTGTLTLGAPAPHRAVLLNGLSEPELLRVLSTVEWSRTAGDPLARAMADAAEESGLGVDEP